MIECEICQANHVSHFQDLSLYQESLQTLKIAQTKFQESAECAEKLEQTTEGSEVLVPLTGSVRIYLFLHFLFDTYSFISVLVTNRCMFLER